MEENRRDKKKKINKTNFIVASEAAPLSTSEVEPELVNILTKYKVNSKSGMWLRESAPKDTKDLNGAHAGAAIECMKYGCNFIEEKRDESWSYGTNEATGKKGWACNIYLENV